MQLQSQHIIDIGSLADLFTACYTIIDDLYGHLVPKEVKKRPAPPPSLSAAEVVTIALIG